MHTSLSLPPAPPLTLDNIFDAVKNVRSWRTLGQHIYSYSSFKLDDIQRRHASNEACHKAVIEGFLNGEGRYKQPSWRAVIWSLYKANEIQLAEHIRSLAEPVQGNFTIDVEKVAYHTRIHMCDSSSLLPLCICAHFLYYGDQVGCGKTSGDIFRSHLRFPSSLWDSIVFLYNQKILRNCSIWSQGYNISIFTPYTCTIFICIKNNHQKKSALIVYHATVVTVRITIHVHCTSNTHWESYAEGVLLCSTIVPSPATFALKKCSSMCNGCPYHLYNHQHRTQNFSY